MTTIMRMGKKLLLCFFIILFVVINFLFNIREAHAAAPSVISKGTAAAGTATSIAPAYPASVLANDIVFILVISHQPVSIGVINTPAGFTQAAQGTYTNSSAVNQGRAALFWQRAAGGETGTVTISRTGDTGTDGSFFGQMYLVRGAETTGDPWDAVIARFGPGNTTVTWNAVTVSGAERTLLAFVSQANNVAVATPSTYTATVTADATANGTDAELQLFDKANVSADGSVTATGGEIIGWTTFHVAVKPPAPPSGPDATSYTNGSETALNFSACATTGCGGRIGQSITITGTAFGTVAAGSRANCAGGAGTGCVRIADTTIADASVTAWSDTSITFTIPSGITAFGGAGTSCGTAGSNGLCVTAAGINDAGGALEFFVFPDITSVSPSGAGEGKEDDSITISGNRFGATSGTVVFQNCAGADVSATVGTWTDISITATVPAGIDNNDDACDIKVTRAAGTGSKTDTSTGFVVLPNITSISTCASCVTNAAREHATGIDTDGVMMLNGNHFGTSQGVNGKVEFTGGFGTVNAPIHATAEGACTTAGWAGAATSICIEVSPLISDTVYTGTITLTRNDLKTNVWTDFRVLPRIIPPAVPASGIGGTIIQLTGDHFCESGTCPESPNRSSASNNVKFGSTQAADSDIVNQTGGAGACDGTGAGWTHTKICVKVPTAAPTGSQPTIVRSGAGACPGPTCYESNTAAFTVVSSVPNDPSSLQQYKSNGTTVISIGGGTNETSVVLKASMSAGVNATLCLQIENAGVATGFTGTVTAEEGGAGQEACKSYTGTPVTGVVTLTGLSNGSSYHWRARVKNNTTGEPSLNWVSFGANTENPPTNPAAIDYYIDTSAPTISIGTPPSCTAHTNVTDVGATISWTVGGESINTSSITNDVRYGTDSTLVSGTTVAGPNGTSPSVELSGLSANATYYYWVKSTDPAGNVTQNPSASPFCQFTTSTAQTRLMKTIDVFIKQQTTVTLGDAFPASFVPFIAESNVSRSNITFKSIIVEVFGISKGGLGDITVNVDFQAGLTPVGVTSHVLADPGTNGTYWNVVKSATGLNYDCPGCTAASANTLNVTVSGANATTLVGAHAIITYFYTP